MSPFLLTTIVLVVATLYFGQRLWVRSKKYKPKKSTDMLDNPGLYRIYAILGILLGFFVLGLVIYDILTRFLN